MDSSRNQPTASVASRLPQELTDAIIDAGKDDKRFLKTCGLVCRAWVPASRRRLFERTALGHHNMVEFSCLVESELVTIPKHIRQLVLHSGQYVLDDTRLLSQLSLVNVLDLNFLDFRGRIRSLERGIDHFRCLMQLHFFRCLFDSFSDLANVLQSCIVVEDLSFDYIKWFSSRTSESGLVAGSLPSLRRLVIRSIVAPEDLIAWLLSLQPVPALHSFTYHDQTWTAHSLNAVLQTLGPTLRHLDMDDVERQMYSTSLDLSHNTELESLAFGLALPYPPSNMTESLFRSVSSSIRDVVFNTSFRGSLNDGHSEHLREIDQIFCQPHFLHLQAISFVTYNPDAREKVEKMVQQNMTGCLSRGILSVKDGLM